MPHINRKSIWAGTTFVAAVVALGGWTSRAGAETLTIDSNSSTIDIAADASVNGTSVSAAEQSTGSLSTNYTGTIDASVSGSNITFNAASADANAQGGSFDPGSADADYAGSFLGLVNVAGRNLVFSITGTSALSGSAGSYSFDASSLTFTFTGGEVDNNANAVLNDGTPASIALAGQSSTNSAAGNGTLTVGAGNVATLTVPVAFTFTPASGVSLTTNGQLSATGVVPEPGALALIGLGGLPLLLRRRRETPAGGSKSRR